jgi:glycosyltransferase involved in cell wall biosynthesis
MDVWLITVGEPLPLPGTSPRLMRTGVLADALAERGHRVTWWTSEVDHYRKERFPASPNGVWTKPNLQVVLLHGMLYRRNVSIARLVNHWQVARNFRLLAPGRGRPDVVLCSLPTVELSAEAVAYGRRVASPVLIDVRDLWPDVLLGVLPSRLRWFGRQALMPLYWKARRALRDASGIVAISEGYYQWARRLSKRPAGPLDAVIPLGYLSPKGTTEVLDRCRKALAARGVDFHKRIAWFVGSFGRTYDLAPVIATARALVAEGRQADILFVFSGAGEREAEWRRAADGLRNVVFTGWLGADEIAAMLKSAYVGLGAYAPGAPQGLPNKLFEYLSAGLPVLSSLQGESADLLAEHQCGLTYQAGNEASLRAGLEQMLRDPAKHESMASNAARLFAERYSSTVVCEQLLALLQRAANKLM